MKDLVSKESGPPSLKKIRKRKEPEKSAFEKAREFARNVPKPKQAKNPDDLKLQPKEILSKSPNRDEFKKLLENHECFEDEVKRMR